MLRTAAPRMAGRTAASGGGAVAAAVPRLPAASLASLRRMHLLPAAAVAASSFLRGDVSRHALMAPR